MQGIMIDGQDDDDDEEVVEEKRLADDHKDNKGNCFLLFVI